MSPFIWVLAALACLRASAAAGDAQVAGHRRAGISGARPLR